MITLYKSSNWENSNGGKFKFHYYKDCMVLLGSAQKGEPVPIEIPDYKIIRSEICIPCWNRKRREEKYESAVMPTMSQEEPVLMARAVNFALDLPSVLKLCEFADANPDKCSRIIIDINKDHEVTVYTQKGHTDQNTFDDILDLLVKAKDNAQDKNPKQFS